MVILLILAFAMATLFFNQWGLDRKRWKRKNVNNLPIYKSPVYLATLYLVLVVAIPIIFVNSNTNLEGVLNGNTFWVYTFAILLSFSISLVWFLYLSWIDIFQRESKWHILLTFVLASGSTYGCLYVYDFVHTVFHFDLNGEILNDFLYCVFGIGLIEELTKLVPFLIILGFTKAIDEPFDYILYGCIAALGFAFIENIQYLYNYDLKTINARSLLASASHMMDTSIIVYGLAIRKFRNKKNFWTNPIVLILMAAFVHGFYDFWLINPKVQGYSFLTLALVIVMIKIWMTMKNNLLNISPHFSYEIKLNSYEFKYRLLNSLLTLAYVGYLLQFLFYSRVAANDFLFGSLFLYMFFLLFMSLNFSSFDVIKDYIAPFKLGRGIPQILTPNLQSAENLTGLKVQIIQNSRASADYANNSFARYLPLEGTLVRRIVLSGDTSWYLMETERNVEIGAVDKNHFLIKPELGTEFGLDHKKFQRIVFRAIGHFPDRNNPIMNIKDTAVIHKLLAKSLI